MVVWILKVSTKLVAYILELNARGALEFVSVRHIALNFENAFLPPLNLLSGTPQDHTCHTGIFC